MVDAFPTENARKRYREDIQRQEKNKQRTADDFKC